MALTLELFCLRETSYSDNISFKGLVSESTSQEHVRHPPEIATNPLIPFEVFSIQGDAFAQYCPILAVAVALTPYNENRDAQKSVYRQTITTLMANKREG